MNTWLLICLFVANLFVCVVIFSRNCNRCIVKHYSALFYSAGLCCIVSVFDIYEMATSQTNW